ncbi:MAG TPA: transcriptional repressor LexA [Nodosilinea sp.]|nr:transcriptional repressor LexA [Nodosilinea sp.]
MILRPSEHRLYLTLRDLIEQESYAPSIRELQEASNLSSRSLVQDLLKRLQHKGYIDRPPGKARAIALRRSELPLQGVVQAGYLTEQPNCCDRTSLDGQRYQTGDYALRVTGDSMVDAQIIDGDIVVIRPQSDLWALRPGQIAVVWIAGEGATLKQMFYSEGEDTIDLRPASAHHASRTLDREQVDLQGVMVGHHRAIEGLWMALDGRF